MNVLQMLGAVLLLLFGPILLLSRSERERMVADLRRDCGLVARQTVESWRIGWAQAREEMSNLK